MFFTVFPPFMPKSELLPLLFSPLLFFKERWEQFAHDSLSEKSESLFRSFPHIKQAIRSKNQREKSLPWNLVRNQMKKMDLLIIYRWSQISTLNFNIISRLNCGKYCTMGAESISRVESISPERIV